MAYFITMPLRYATRSLVFFHTSTKTMPSNILYIWVTISYQGPGFLYILITFLEASYILIQEHMDLHLLDTPNHSASVGTIGLLLLIYIKQFSCYDTIFSSLLNSMSIDIITFLLCKLIDKEYPYSISLTQVNAWRIWQGGS